MTSVIPPPAPLPSTEDSSSHFTIDPVTGKKKWDTVQVDSNHQEAYNWSVKEDWTFNPSNTKVIHELDQPLPWERAIGVHTTEDGSELFFIELEELGIVTLKGSLTIASDVFANDLALLAGLQDVPKMKLVCEMGDPQYDAMVEALWKLEATKRSPELTQENASSKLAKSLHNRCSFILMEFVRGHDLQTLLSEEEGNLVKRILKNNSVLETIGHLIGFDLYVNNWDRFPYVWRNNGNAKNVMINVQKERAFGIDHTFTSIDPNQFPENCQEYLDSVSKAIDDIIQNPEKETESTARVRNFIKENANADIEEKGSISIQKGILESVARIAQLDIKSITKTKRDIEKRISPTTKEYGLPEEAVGLNRIVPDFLDQIHSLFQSKAQSISSVLNSNRPK